MAEQPGKHRMADSPKPTAQAVWWWALVGLITSFIGALIAITVALMFPDLPVAVGVGIGALAGWFPYLLLS